MKKRIDESIPFRSNAATALKNSSLRHAMATATGTFTKKRAEGLASVPIQEWREEASRIRSHVVDNLREYVDRFAENASKRGAQIHHAEDAAAACSTVEAILKRHGAEKVVKVKSMVTEEIHLNAHLEKSGVEVVETDLGEYIVQIAGETPSHILAPAIHKNRQEIGRLFTDKLGVEYSEDPEVLTKIARHELRGKFLNAEAGISGANFAIADTGSLVIFTNEGNGRLVTTLPPLHIAVLTLEKMIPALADLPAFIRLLPRSATGQTLSSYLSLITGTRGSGDGTGAEELHIVLLDNGRTEIQAGEFREILKCIRCSACMNVCPVYRMVGGHAYGSTYPGPMGIVLTAALEGLERAHSLAEASTLCGACVDACPVKVPLVKLIRRLREKRVEEGLTPAPEHAAMRGFSIASKSPKLFAAGQQIARVLWPILRAAGRSSVLGRLPRPVPRTFRRRMSE